MWPGLQRGGRNGEAAGFKGEILEGEIYRGISKLHLFSGVSGSGTCILSARVNIISGDNGILVYNIIDLKTM